MSSSSSVFFSRVAQPNFRRFLIPRQWSGGTPLIAAVSSLTLRHICAIVIEFDRCVWLLVKNVAIVIQEQQQMVRELLIYMYLPTLTVRVGSVPVYVPLLHSTVRVCHSMWCAGRQAGKQAGSLARACAYRRQRRATVDCFETVPSITGNTYSVCVQYGAVWQQRNQIQRVKYSCSFVGQTQRIRLQCVALDIPGTSRLNRAPQPSQHPLVGTHTPQECGHTPAYSVLYVLVLVRTPTP